MKTRVVFFDSLEIIGSRENIELVLSKKGVYYEKGMFKKEIY